MRTYFRNARVR